MGLCNARDIFQENMTNLFRELEYVRKYIDDLLITTNSSFTDHLEKLSIVLAKLEKAGLKVNALKSSFYQPEVEYLGFLITRQGIKPQPKKVESIHNMAPPKKRKDVRKFLGIVNYYRDMLEKRSDILAPLSRLTSKNVPFEWGKKEQQLLKRSK